MRMSAQMRMGFYPCPPAMVEMVSARLRAPSGRFSMIDPCSGEGAVLAQLKNILGCLPEDVCGIELDEGRSEKLKAALPGSNILAPASVFGVAVGWGSIGFAWVNPPFDDEIGGGERTEEAFLAQATTWLHTRGVLCLVCPEKVLRGYYGTCGADDCNSDLSHYIASHYEKITVLEFPEEHRKYGEVFVLAVKRPEPLKRGSVPWRKCLAPSGFIYHIPETLAPRRFEKVEPTENEFRAMLAGSPLRKVLTVAVETPLPRPPMPVNAGHRAMMLSAGHLDGLVCPPGELPHVVRGTVRKEAVLVSETETEDDDGNVTTKTVMGEKVVLIVRVVEANGTLTTLLEGEGGPKDDDASDE